MKCRGSQEDVHGTSMEDKQRPARNSPLVVMLFQQRGDRQAGKSNKGHQVRPHIQGLVVPSKQCQRSLQKGHLSSKATQNVLVAQLLRHRQCGARLQVIQAPHESVGSAQAAVLYTQIPDVMAYRQSRGSGGCFSNQPSSQEANSLQAAMASS
eukprot:231191-Chlamydomonas_euryale.AAC.5